MSSGELKEDLMLRRHLVWYLVILAVGLAYYGYKPPQRVVVPVRVPAEIPVMSCTSDIVNLDEPEDLGLTYRLELEITRVGTLPTPPTEAYEPVESVGSTPMVVRWAEAVSGASGGIRCENRGEAWTVMHSLASRNLDGSGRIYSVWMTEELSARAPKVDNRPTMTALHLDRVMKLSCRLRYLSDYSKAESHDDKSIAAALQEVSRLNDEREILLANLCDEFAENPRGYDEFVANTVVPAWRDLADSWKNLEEAITPRITSPQAYILH